MSGQGTNVGGSASVFRCLGSLVVALALVRTAAADPPGRLVELLDSDERPFPRLESSGVAYRAGRLFVVDDTENELFVFDTGGRLLARFRSEEIPAAQAKFEDIAYDEKRDSFVAIGSHSGWDVETLERQSLLLEFRLHGLDGIDGKSIRELSLRPSFERLGLWKPRGMKIEGAAIDDRSESLYIGLREPTDRARVYRVGLEGLRSGTPELELAVEFDAGTVAATPYCVSALVWDSTAAGLLIATSTEDEASHGFLGNRLWFWSPGAEPVLLLDRFDEGRKAEGLTLGAGWLFVVYDNDQDDTGLPSQLRIIPSTILFDSLRASP